MTKHITDWPVRTEITVTIQKSGGKYTIHGGLSLLEAEKLVGDCFGKKIRAKAMKGDELIGESYRFTSGWNWFFDPEA